MGKEIVAQTHDNLQPTTHDPSTSKDDLGYEFEDEVLLLLRDMLLAHAQNDVYQNNSSPSFGDKEFVQNDLIALSTILAGPGRDDPVPDPPPAHTIDYYTTPTLYGVGTWGTQQWTGSKKDGGCDNFARMVVQAITADNGNKTVIGAETIVVARSTCAVGIETFELVTEKCADLNVVDPGTGKYEVFRYYNIPPQWFCDESTPECAEVNNTNMGVLENCETNQNGVDICMGEHTSNWAPRTGPLILEDEAMTVMDAGSLSKGLSVAVYNHDRTAIEWCVELKRDKENSSPWNVNFTADVHTRKAFDGSGNAGRWGWKGRIDFENSQLEEVEIKFIEYIRSKSKYHNISTEHSAMSAAAKMVEMKIRAVMGAKGSIKSYTAELEGLEEDEMRKIADIKDEFESLAADWLQLATYHCCDIVQGNAIECSDATNHLIEPINNVFPHALKKPDVATDCTRRLL